MEELSKLLEEYHKAPQIYQAGRYWKEKENEIIKKIKQADIKELRSGKYEIFAAFGFSETTYNYYSSLPFYINLAKKFIREYLIADRNVLPYTMSLSDIRGMAYRHCEIMGELAGIKPISELETSTFGNPQDLFEIKGKKYTMAFLTNYVRLCYAQKYLKLQGNETVVELGSGSGHQVEILKKVFPNLTILCFDLPYVLHLCGIYLSNILGEDMVNRPIKTIQLNNIQNLEKGKVYMFGNWQFPLIKDIKFDVFWNAASFGEMEPDIVKNYLSFVLDNCKFITLIQAKFGKESSKSSGVVTPITFEDYVTMLGGFELIYCDDAYQANARLSQSRGYFYGIWRKEEMI